VRTTRQKVEREVGGRGIRERKVQSAGSVQGRAARMAAKLR
jgi:hypothetical protein